LEPIVKFRRYKVFEHAAVRKFYSLLRSVRGVNLLHQLTNKQTLPGIMGRMPPGTGTLGQGKAHMDSKRH
jgi:hypothetical protein